MRLAEAEQERLAREGETAVETAARLEEEKAALLAEAFSAEQTVGAALGAAREECEKLGRTVEGLRDGEKYTPNGINDRVHDVLWKAFGTVRDGGHYIYE